MSGESGAVILFGGAFDPPHFGHLHLARAARDSFPAAPIWIAPNGRPLHRPPAAANWAARLKMTRAMFGGEDRMRVCAIENPRAGGYAADTLARLARVSPAAPVLLLGADAFSLLDQWRSLRAVISRAGFWVAARADSPFTLPAAAAELDEVKNPNSLSAGKVCYWRDVSPPPVSSTQARAAMANNDSTESFFPAAVHRVIKSGRLYENAAAIN